MIVEKDAVVINNADPLGIGRLQVFIYGIHDITGTKTPFEDLPWAFSTQSAQTLTIPEVFSPIKIKYRLAFGKNILFDFADQEALEWHSPSPYLNLTDNRDPRKFLIYDNVQQKFLNDTPPDYTAINNKLSQLKEQKKEKESQREVLAQNIKDLNLDISTSELNTLLEQQTQTNQEYATVQTQITNLGFVQNIERRDFAQKTLNDFEVYYETTYSSIYGNIDSLYNTNQSLYTQLQDSYTYPLTEEFRNKQRLERENLTNKSNELLTQLKTISDKIKPLNTKQNNLNENKITVQKELDAVSKEIQDIDKQITDLNSKSSSSAVALTSIEQVKSSDSRVGRYDEQTGKVYDTQERLIGNWTGSTFYLPGFAGQSGIPIYERKLEGRIRLTSYLLAVNNNGSISGNKSTYVDSSDSKAIENSNNDKTWNCDISYETRLKILTKRQEIATAVRWLRDQILALFPIDGNSAISQWVKATATHLTALLKSIQKFLKFVNDVIVEIAKITAQIRQLINWILSLPVRLLVLLQDCLTHFFNSISGALSESISLGGEGGSNISFTEVTDLVTQAQSTFNTATETVEATAIVYTEIKSIEATFEKV